MIIKHLVNRIIERDKVVLQKEVKVAIQIQKQIRQ